MNTLPIALIIASRDTLPASALPDAPVVEAAPTPMRLVRIRVHLATALRRASDALTPAAECLA